MVLTEVYKRMQPTAFRHCAGDTAVDHTLQH